MAVIEIPGRTVEDRDFISEVEQILEEVRRLRSVLDSWALPTPPKSLPVHGRGSVIPINRAK